MNIQTVAEAQANSNLFVCYAYSPANRMMDDVIIKHPGLCYAAKRLTYMRKRSSAGSSPRMERQSINYTCQHTIITDSKCFGQTGKILFVDVSHSMTRPDR